MDVEEVWTALLGQLKSYPGMNASQVDAFFSRVQLQAASAGFAMLTSDNTFIKDWIEKHYLKDIQKALKDLYGVDFMVQIEVDPTFSPQNQTEQPTQNRVAQSSDNSALPERNTPLQQANSADSTNPRRIDGATLSVIQSNKVNSSQREDIYRTTEPVQSSVSSNSKESEGSSSGRGTSHIVNNLTFDTFVIGTSNRMAYSMAVEVADRPGNSALNPLFIYGRSGVGKTHLLCAIKNYIEDQYPEYNVCYIDSMELVNRYSDAAIEKSVDKQSFKNFESFFQQADVLLVDDVQGLQGKPGTLDALFRIFNALIPKGKQFVFSADRAPKNIDLDERYVSRFNSGATIDIQPPDDETKRNIIKSFISQYKKEENFDFTISEDVLDYIVENSSSNVRELKSAVTNVIFALKMDTSHDISESHMKELLGNHFISGGKKQINIEMIQSAVESFYSVSHKDLLGKKKERRIVRPRQVAIYLCRELSEHTLKDIGAAFNRDHTTVMHSCDLINNQLQEDRNLREELEAIREKIRIQQF